MTPETRSRLAALAARLQSLRAQIADLRPKRSTRGRRPAASPGLEAAIEQLDDVIMELDAIRC